MISRRLVRWSALCCAVLASVLGLDACDSDDGGSSVPGLEVRLYGPSGPSDPFVGVGWIRITASGEGLASTFTQTVPYSPGGSASLDGIPFSVAGQSREIVVEGLSDQGGQPGFVVSRGRATGLEVFEGAPIQQLNILFARVNDFLPLISTATQASQQLLNARVGHEVTVTVGEVVITGGGTISNSTSTWWNGAGFQSISSSVEALGLRTRELASRTSMIVPRAWHAGTALSSGQIIITGGYSDTGSPTETTELYNPPGVLEGRAVQLPPMSVARAGHTATLIDDATRLVLLVGGDTGGTYELWDPVNGSTPYGGAKPLPDGLVRRHHQATTFYLPGRDEPAVLISGGESDAFVHATAMLFDSAALSLIPLSKALPGGARTQHSSVYVPNRSFIYLAGGFADVGRQGTLAAIDVFEIGSTAFREGNEGFRMAVGRGGHQATLLADNLVCMAGGVGEEPPGSGLKPLGSLEVIHEFIDTTTNSLRIEVASSYNPGGVGQIPYLEPNRVGHRMVSLDGMALVVGGAAIENGAGGYRMVKDLVLYNPQ